MGQETQRRVKLSKPEMPDVVMQAMRDILSPDRDVAIAAFAVMGRYSKVLQTAGGDLRKQHDTFLAYRQDTFKDLLDVKPLRNSSAKEGEEDTEEVTESEGD